MRKLRAKLRSQQGETLIELMVSIIVVLIATSVLATMVIAAGKLNNDARSATEAMYEDIGLVEQGAGSSNSGQVKIVLGNDRSTVTVPVEVYQEGEFISYRVAGGDE